MRSNIEESRLARAAAEGDGQAFAQLYDRYERPVYNYCLRLLGNEHDAQDATQDAFLKVMRRLPQMGDRELDFGAYLYTVARNASYDMIGKRKKTAPVEEIAEDTGQLLGDGPAVDEDPLRSALLDAERDSIKAANARLPERQREVLALREIQGMSYEDIADLLEMNSNSVAQLISRARIRLRDELRGEAASAVAASSPECERALPLLAQRQDGKLKDGPDSTWLADHMAACTTCPLAAEAMAEAGLSYRAWAPVLPAAWLFRDTVAKAAKLVGADWSGITRPTERAREGGATDPAGGDGHAVTPASSAGPVGAGAAATEKARRRRGLLVGSLSALLLLLGAMATTVLGGENEEPAAEITPPAAEGSAPTAPTTERSDSGGNNPAHSKRPSKSKPAAKRAAKRKPPPTPPASSPAAAPASSTTVSPSTSGSNQPSGSEPAADRPEAQQPKSRGKAEVAGGGTGSWGARSRPDRPPAATTPEPPAPPTPAPPTTVPPPAEPPPAEDPRDPPAPPGGRNEPPPDGGNQPPPSTTPCFIRVCP